MNGSATIAAMYFQALGDAYGFDLDTPVRATFPGRAWTRCSTARGTRS